MSSLMAGCELTMLLVVLAANVGLLVFYFNWPRVNTLVSLDLSACLYPVSGMPLYACVWCLFWF